MRKLRDFICTNEDCADLAVKKERLADDTTPPACKTCGKPMQVVPSFPIVPNHVSWSKWRI